MNETYLDFAKKYSQEKFDELRQAMLVASDLVYEKACVYATGSFGREEAGQRSDLDLFIVSKEFKVDRNGEIINVRSLSGIEEIKLKYELVKAVEACGLPEFDGDGRFLECHTLENFIKYLGGPEDDYRNTLTGRLLLLLESKPLVGIEVYNELVDSVVSRYFIDFIDNTDQFIPAFLFNDILRMWRTFCVNYEYNRKVGSSGSKIKNLKLKYSRMLTCYSGLLFLLAVFKMSGTVSPDDVREMIRKTPVERLNWVRSKFVEKNMHNAGDVGKCIDDALSAYADFLKFAQQEKQVVICDYEANPEIWRKKSYEFGSLMAQALSLIGISDGEKSKLYRLILI